MHPPRPGPGGVLHRRWGALGSSVVCWMTLGKAQPLSESPSFFSRNKQVAELGHFRVLGLSLETG